MVVINILCLKYNFPQNPHFDGPRLKTIIQSCYLLDERHLHIGYCLYRSFALCVSRQNVLLFLRLRTSPQYRPNYRTRLYSDCARRSHAFLHQPLNCPYLLQWSRLHEFYRNSLVFFCLSCVSSDLFCRICENLDWRLGYYHIELWLVQIIFNKFIKTIKIFDGAL